MIGGVKMNKTRKTLLLACITVLLCVAIIAGGAYAFFADSVTLQDHLFAGQMQVSLERINLKSTFMNNSTGELEEITNKNIVDFSKETTENVFGLKADTLIVPGSSYQATMRVSNNGNAAFGYWLEIITKDESDKEFVSQLTIKVQAGEFDIEQKLSDFTVGSEGDYVGVVAKGSDSTFIVEIAFDNYDDNNLSMDKEIKFDLIVYAVQVTNNN